ncbi:MAG TPA: sensor domain-containing protein [Jatrophihabitans sp.]|nr:sensor domain-containing protein [Jatrophihabitans sp.]
MLDGFRPRIRHLWWSFMATLLAAACLVLFVFTLAGVGVIVVWVGLPMLLVGMYLVRPIANFHRRQIAHIDGRPPIESPYLATPSGNLFVRVRALLRDPATVRDAIWLLLNGTIGLGLAIIGIVESVLDLIFWWLPPGIALRAHAGIARGLLSVSEKSRLALRVQQLTESRAETVDTQAAELRRIERDLHDGAQARLVALGMSLAMAEQQLERDPETARALLTEARTASSDALAELRDLVRGIHPPVLADRGLDGAVQALALAAPMPVVVRIDVPARLPAPLESAAYFAVAEALTNVVKHAHAKSAEVSLVQQGEELMISVRDDGVGGADPGGGTGLRGIERRLSAFDGTLHVESPSGGPTEVVMVLPCVSSSPKTSPSSGTA